ncbi:hypothetical protein [Streptomyces sp. NPDC093269]|uniref:hypothetical protein n=1 Tax=Streptomyces sp. NPDC093269 TaxID=3366038 RepID=UPI00381AC58E
MTVTSEARADENDLIVDAAARAALTVIARTVPLDPEDRGEHFRGLHAAHATFRSTYTSQAWPKERVAAVRAWVSEPTPDGTEDYREGYEDFTHRISCILASNPYVIANVLDEDLMDMPLERINYGAAL